MRTSRSCLLLSTFPQLTKHLAIRGLLVGLVCLAPWPRVRLVSILLACICTTATVRADDRVEIERHLKKEYQGKTVILRDFYSGESLRYDIAGKLLEGGAAGPWTLYGRIRVKKVSLRQDRIEIEGERLFLAYKEKRKIFKAIAGQKVKIEVGMQPDSMNEDSLRQAMTKVFLSGGDELADVVPSYWKAFLLRDKEQQHKPFRPVQARTTEKERKIFRIDGKNVSPPTCGYCPDPEYTREAHKARYEGVVVLWTIVDETGQVLEIRVQKPVGMGLDDAAVHAVRNWHFKPAKRAGKAVPVYVTMEVNFGPSMVGQSKASRKHREAMVRTEKGLYDQAVALLEGALKLEPSNAGRHQAIGTVYLLKQDYEKARKQQQMALSLNPDSDEAQYFLALSYFVEGHYEEAIKELGKYLQMADSPRAYAVLHQYHSLRELGKEREAARALTDYEHAFGGSWELALLQYHQGKLADFELVSRAQDRHERCEAFFYVGYQYLLEGDKPKAREYFQKTVETKVFEYFEYVGAKSRLQQLALPE